MASEERIESAINREVAGALTIRPQSGGIAAFTIEPRSMSDVMEFAKLMAISGICIRPIFRGNPGACLAVTLQAMKWGADPFAVANKAFVVNDQLSYESQLVHAIVNSSARLAKRLDAAFEGDGPGRQCRVNGYIKGDDEAREYLSPKLGEIPTKNSPLWKADPDQQLFYYSTRAWARRWLPEVLLGIYTPEELAPAVELTAEPNPAELKPHKQSKLERFEQRAEPSSPETPQEAATAPAASARPDVPPEPTEPSSAPVLAAAATESPAGPAPPVAQKGAGTMVAGDAESAGERMVPRGTTAATDLLGAAVTTPDTPRESQAVPIPGRRGGEPDYRGYIVGLIIPKMRQRKTSADLAWFLGDNDEDIEVALSKEPALRADFETAKAAQWEAIGNG